MMDMAWNCTDNVFLSLSITLFLPLSLPLACALALPPLSPLSNTHTIHCIVCDDVLASGHLSFVNLRAWKNMPFSELCNHMHLVISICFCFVMCSRFVSADAIITRAECTLNLRENVIRSLYVYFEQLNVLLREDVFTTLHLYSVLLCWCCPYKIITLGQKDHDNNKASV